MAEILPGVHQIPVNYNGRPLQLYLLLGGGVSLLMDAGDASVPEKDILPHFKTIGFDPKNLTYVMATHPDVDHTGGLFRLRQAAPQARFVCGTADREQIEDPDALIEQRYRLYYQDHGLGPDDAAKAKLLPRCGGHVDMDLTFAGGEVLSLGPGKDLRILHLPGHSHGHLGVYLPWENTAIVADAVQSRSNNYLDGRAAFAPAYMYVDDYLGTIRQLEAMQLTRLYSCHWGNQESVPQVAAFLAGARDYALQAEKAILETVRAAPAEGITLRDICLQAKPKLGDWPGERDLDTRWLAGGHLERLVGMGMVEAGVGGGLPVRYRYAPKWNGI